MTMQTKPANLSDMVEQAVVAIPGLGKFGMALSNELHSIATGSALARRITDFLHGTWMGHPLHPMLTDIVVGSWSLAAVADGLALATGSETLEEGADALIVAGLLAVVPTAVTGLADYSGIYEDAVPTATAHAIGNDIGASFYLVSLFARRRGRRGLGIVLSLIGYAVMGLSASLGGALVFRQKVGVNHTPDVEPSNDWKAVLADGELPPDTMKRVRLGNDKVVLLRHDSRLYAMSAVCSHAGGPLEGGSLDGTCVTCPWHHSVFDFRDGHVVHGPATIPQSRYETRIRDGQIEVRVIES
jgi:nitrite reductase/ring-hydroxylating ferredoxin subunit/uncharacterized membrane protein